MTPSPSIDHALEDHRAGRLAEAESAYRALLSADPGHAAATHFLGYLAYQCGRLDEAVRLMQRSVAREPENAIFHNNLGEAYRAAGLWDAAIASYQRAIERAPDYGDPAANLVLVLRSAGRGDEALTAGREAAARHPKCARAHDALGLVLQERSCWREAAASHERATELDPASAEARTNLGVVLAELRQPEAAVEQHRRAIELNPSLAAAHLNLGSALNVLCRWEEARAAYERAIELAPELPEAHGYLGVLLLLHEEYERGWPEFEWRVKCKWMTPPLELSGAPWKGEPLEGRTILVYTTSGFGDSIAFVRYAPLLTKLGARVLLACEPGLFRLFRSIPGVETVPRSAPFPHFDFHSSLDSLPLHFRTNAATIPAQVPYLFPSADRVDRWRDRVAALPGLRVGLNWAGSKPGLHSNTLETFAPLAAIPGVTYVSLQMGKQGAQTLAPPAGMSIVDWTSEIEDFADTAGLVSLLDLIITIDTSVAHLAGALARPEWTLIPAMPHFYWGASGEQTPWYPAMRLYRQRELSKWEEPVAAMAKDLAKLVSGDEG